jgi:DtxR family transcriptional regulator, Mn-dependent transcriptional regulator
MPAPSNVSIALLMLRAELHAELEPGQAVPAGLLIRASGLAPSTISGLLRTAATAGLVNYTARHGARLTAAGRHQAMRQLRRHRLVETFLNRSLGLDWAEVHEEAQRIDAAVSDRVIERMAEILGHPTIDPHGDIIPDAQGRMPTSCRTCCRTAMRPSEAGDIVAGSLDRFPTGAHVTIVHVLGNDTAFMHLLGDHGLTPGVKATIATHSQVGGTISVCADGGRPLTLGSVAASQIHAERTPAPRRRLRSHADNCSSRSAL